MKRLLLVALHAVFFISPSIACDITEILGVHDGRTFLANLGAPYYECVVVTIAGISVDDVHSKNPEIKHQAYGAKNCLRELVWPKQQQGNRKQPNRASGFWIEISHVNYFSPSRNQPASWKNYSVIEADVSVFHTPQRKKKRYQNAVSPLLVISAQTHLLNKGFAKKVERRY